MKILIIKKFFSQTLNLKRKKRFFISIWVQAKFVKENVQNNLGIYRHKINNLKNLDVAV